MASSWGFQKCCVTLVFALLINGCGSDDQLTVTRDSAGQSVTGWRVLAASVEQVYRVPGNVTADDRIQLSSRITGFIQQIAVREGDRVVRGDLLVEIESAEVTGAIRTAKAALTAAETDLEDARRDVAKFAELAEQGSLPADTLRKAKVRFDLAQSQLVEASSASETAVSNLRYTSIRSPVDGVVISLNKRVGDLATTGAPILLIESQSSLVFQTYVAEKRVAALAVGQKIAVELDALERPLHGEVLRIVPSGDPVTRRFEVKVSLPSTLNLLPGMFGRARFVVGATNRVLVARSMLVERGGLVGVMAIVDDQAEFRWLRIGQQWPGQVEVIGGLDEGELIVAEPSTELFDGAPLIVLSEG